MRWFVAVSKQMYFTEMQWKHGNNFFASQKTHDQQPDVITGKNDKEDDDKK